MFIGIWWHWNGDISLSVRGKRIIWAWAFKNWGLPTQIMIFSGFLDKNIRNCPPRKLFLFTALNSTGGFIVLFSLKSQKWILATEFKLSQRNDSVNFYQTFINDRRKPLNLFFNSMVWTFNLTNWFLTKKRSWK